VLLADNVAEEVRSEPYLALELVDGKISPKGIIFANHRRAGKIETDAAKV